VTGARRIDLNADLGESFGAWSMGADLELLPFVTSINVACGFHAGDPSVMDGTVAAAARAGVAVGAHPGYYDLRGFGRRKQSADPGEVEHDVLYQVGALLAFTRAHGVRLTHVKPHGALYNQAAVEEPLAAAVARGVARASRDLVLVGLASGKALRAAAEREGLRFAAEGFADRRYQPDGTLTRRGTPGAVITDPADAAAQAVSIAAERRVTCSDASSLTLSCDTLCLHGDTPGAAALARAVRGALESRGVAVASLNA
jgi:5-oxoprolinase (ATP-hydrolysing) subunit A